ncbi:MAG TPA: 1,4-dihydroxy-2-naphthoate octaprenyltransferase [Xanthobacteraceae bacterium]|nr:1,4-dihydroxy-2-naphthoate octaprenyltransferase [Xanthobacteraceae bacterium]
MAPAPSPIVRRKPDVAAAVSPWLMAARPRTLGLSVTPVVVGAALAWAAQQQVHWVAALAALAGSICIQLGTNLHNDAVDSERGGDGPDRVGPPRVTAMGLLSAGSVKRGAALCFAAAAVIGLYLVVLGGWPILLLGILSIISGWAYTGGPWPIAYTPLGELFVVAFFGVGAVGGTYWLCAGNLAGPVLTTGVALGLMTGAVLLVNNFRDREADARVGRRTLAIVAGPTITASIYAALMLLPYALLLPIGRALPDHMVWLALFALPPTLVLIYRFVREPPGRGFNRIMVRTVQIQVLFSLLLAIGLAI